MNSILGIEPLLGAVLAVAGFGFACWWNWYGPGSGGM